MTDTCILLHTVHAARDQQIDKGKEQSMLYHWYRVLDFGPDFFWRADEGLHC